MSFQTFQSRASFPKEVYSYFDFDKLDAFHSEEINGVINGKNWECILITNDKNAFFHIYSKNNIPNTEYFDIEPLFGYNGPIINKPNRQFLTLALELYREHCISNKIIAELFRFNPLIGNHQPFKDSLINISPAKEIIIVNCHTDKETQLKEFKRLGKRYINNIINDSEIRFFENKPLDVFQNYYRSSLQQHNANKIWYFDDSFFSRATESDKFVLVELKYKGELKILSLVIKSHLAYYHFITSILEPRVKGLNEYLIMTLALHSAKNNSKYLILGGGNTSDEEDPLLLYKKNFNKTSTIFFIGKAVYIPEVFNCLCMEFINSNLQHIDSPVFLKYRL